MKFNTYTYNLFCDTYSSWEQIYTYSWWANVAICSNYLCKLCKPSRHTKGLHTPSPKQPGYRGKKKKQKQTKHPATSVSPHPKTSLKALSVSCFLKAIMAITSRSGQVLTYKGKSIPYQSPTIRPHNPSVPGTLESSNPSQETLQALCSPYSLLLLTTAEEATLLGHLFHPNKSLMWGLLCAVTLWYSLARIPFRIQLQQVHWRNFLDS